MSFAVATAEKISRLPSFDPSLYLTRIVVPPAVWHANFGVLPPRSFPLVAKVHGSGSPRSAPSSPADCFSGRPVVTISGVTFPGSDQILAVARYRNRCCAPAMCTNAICFSLWAPTLVANTSAPTATRATAEILADIVDHPCTVTVLRYDPEVERVCLTGSTIAEQCSFRRRTQSESARFTRGQHSPDP